jgi:hypothetical protein
MPDRKLPDEKIGDAEAFILRRTIRIRKGGIRSTAYQRIEGQTRRIRDRRSRVPLFLSTIRVRTNPAMLGRKKHDGDGREENGVLGFR